MSRGLSTRSRSQPKPRRSMVPGRKFSSSTSARRISLRRMSCPSGAFRLSVRLFLPRLTAMKYVASPPAKGGQPRVSSPLPGSSTLMTSAPMSASSMEQKGPASTRVRSTTRIPASGGRTARERPRAAREAGFDRPFSLATRPPFPDALDDALGDGGHLLAPGARPSPEEARPIGEAQGREVEDGVHGLDGHARADLDAAGLVTVAEETGPALELHQRDVQRGAKALRRGVQRREGPALPDPGHGVRLHPHPVIGARRCRRHHEAPAAGAARGGDDGLVDHDRAASRTTQLLVAMPPMDWASPTRAFTCRPSARPESCQVSSTIWAMPVAASG